MKTSDHLINAVMIESYLPAYTLIFDLCLANIQLEYNETKAL
jgi:hypothetical protein